MKLRPGGSRGPGRFAWQLGFWCRCGSTIPEASSATKPTIGTRRPKEADSQPKPRTKSLEEALYLAKLAGVYTASEVQYQIVKGPEFSRDNSPFMLENFLEAEAEEPEISQEEILEDAFERHLRKAEEDFISPDEIKKVLGDEEVIMAFGEAVCQEIPKFISANPENFKKKEGIIAEGWTGTMKEWQKLMMTFQVDNKEVDGKQTWTANSVIHEAIQRYFKPEAPPKFWHDQEEWLSRCEGRGTRKRAAAHAVLLRGTGLFRVNGQQDMYHRWPQIYHRIDVCQPFKLTGTAGIYDVFVSVRGGGLSGQAGATRLAVARALFQANPNCHDRLQRGFCLLEDTRQKMSKMPGKPSAQASFVWNKR